MSRFKDKNHGLCLPPNRAGLINCLLGAAGISLPAEFTLGRERTCTLFAWSCFGSREFLSFTGESRLLNAAASTAGTFGTTLATVSFSYVCITFPGPLVLNHGATGARRHRG